MSRLTSQFCDWISKRPYACTIFALLGTACFEGCKLVILSPGPTPNTVTDAGSSRTDVFVTLDTMLSFALQYRNYTIALVLFILVFSAMLAFTFILFNTSIVLAFIGGVGFDKLWAYWHRDPSLCASTPVLLFPASKDSRCSSFPQHHQLGRRKDSVSAYQYVPRPPSCADSS